MREDLRDRSPLDARGQRAVAEIKRERDAIVERVREFSLAIVCAQDAQRVRKLALAIYTGGLVPESIEWVWTSRLIGNASCLGICKQCGSCVEETGGECPTIYRDLCPAEFGAVRYADVCAA